MNKKVYFAGSIRGGRLDANLYKKIIEHIKKTDFVLTEHIGDINYSSKFVSDDKDKQIYLQDTSWIKDADLIIAECSTPSLGVGYELAFAESYKKPCFCLYNLLSSNLSAMIKGNSYFKVYPYKSDDEIFTILDKILNE